MVYNFHLYFVWKLTDNQVIQASENGIYNYSEDIYIL